MKHIDLHIGHGKTGTSIIQTFFAKSVKDLFEQNIIYPEHTNLNSARKLSVTSGSFNTKEELERVVTDYVNSPSSKRLLLSSEWLFWWFEDLLSFFIETNKIAPIRVILFVRNPAELIHSNYNELVKARNFQNSFVSYLKQDKHFSKSCWIIQKLKEEKISLNLSNYSFCKHNLLNYISNILNFTPHKHIIESVGITRINRSLTNSELYFQKLINKSDNLSHYKKLGIFMSKQLPNLEVEKKIFTKFEGEEFLKINAEYLDFINKHLPKEQVLETKVLENEEHQNNKYCFSEEQLSTLVEFLNSVEKEN